MKRQDYEVLVIGGGPGGTPTAMALASAGKQVLLVEKGEGLGGTCLFEGCIPSKVLRESARRKRELEEAMAFGLCLPPGELHVDWSAIQERKRAILKRRSQGALHHGHRLPTLEVVFGTVKLLGDGKAAINNADGTGEIHFKQAVVATGSVPFLPPIPGLDHPSVINSESILNIDHIPDQLVIIGGGPTHPRPG
jgi:dihydrolipoamide dehydrogenase